MIPPQIITAICWVFGSAILGTLSARDIVAKERRPSTAVSSAKVNAIVTRRRMLTHASYDLGLQTILTGKTTSEITYTTMAIPCHIRNFANVIEHMATREEEDSNQTNSSPNIAVLKNWQKIWPSHKSKRDGPKKGRCNGNATYPVDRSLDRWVWSIWESTSNPRVNLLSGLWACNS